MEMPVTSPFDIQPIPALVEMEQVSDVELSRYARLIYDRTGIQISPRKKTLLSNRLRRRLRQTGIADFGRYFEHLQSLPSGHPEWDAFLQEITTHETYLFRDEAQWAWFRTTFLPSWGTALSTPGRTLRIWSAACSTGDEAFTIACCVAAALPAQASRVQIVGTDIGVGAVEQARKGEFGERAMQRVPEDLRRRFFVRLEGASTWQAKPVLKNMTTFRHHNLMEPLREKPFDLVFLKNVLIYFDLASKKTVVDNVRAAIVAGGILVAGASEGVSDLVRDFTRINPWLFRKGAK